MKRFLLAALLIASTAWGLDKLGTIYVTDGGTANNVTTTVRDAGLQADAGVITDGGATDFLWAGNGFNIPVGTNSVIECRQDCHINTDVFGCDAGTCPRLYGEQWLQLYVAHNKGLTYTRRDGTVLVDGGLQGTTTSYFGGFVAISPADGGTTCICDVYANPEPKR